MYIDSSYTISAMTSYQRIHTPFMQCNESDSCRFGWKLTGSTR